MGYRTLRQCVEDLERTSQLVRVEQPVDARLEAAEIHRRVFRSGGPAVYFANVKDCRFPMVSNLFGTKERMRYIFRDTLHRVRRLIELRVNPGDLGRHPLQYLSVVPAGLSSLPRRVSRAAVTEHETSIGQLPQLQCWPDDGGAFITLPVVYTENVLQPGMRNSNLGMYRVQLSGGQYQPDRQVGLHYQIHRGIGVHHAAAIRQGRPLRVSLSVGGTPAMTLAAVMPLPEGMSELAFAGALAGHRIPMYAPAGTLPLYAQADFCITGTVNLERQMPEGPFGDHLGYYSLVHDFPVLNVEHVYHRNDPIWPFTVVGRPPQEDTMFGELIHELTGPAVPTLIAGLHAVHAVDAAGVHPLMLAIGSERYVPYEQVRQPREVLTQASAILGQGQMSLAKYLLMVAREDDPTLDIHDIAAFFAHLLQRADWTRDLHFQTCTTIDTLDYSGTGLNEGSKLVIAGVGPTRRQLASEIPAGLQLPQGFRSPRICLPGVLAVSGPDVAGSAQAPGESLSAFCRLFHLDDLINRFALVLLVDDSEFTARSLNNFLWVTFTRSNPAADVDGIGAFVKQKHWGCRGSLVIDARRKPHHAPPLIEDADVAKKVDAMAARGGPLARWL